MRYSQKEILTWDKKYRLKFINSVSGYKGVHLIATKGKDGLLNVAIFNSVVHISSEPARIGFIMRPLTVPRDTYTNIIETKRYTINHVHEAFLEQVHYTSSKSQKTESEFDFCQLTPSILNGFNAPFVKESNIKLGMKLIEDIPLSSTDCRMIIGEVEFIDIDENFVESDGQIDLQKAKNICVTGLNQYSSVKKKKKLPYARLSELPDFKENKRPDNIVFDEENQVYNAHSLAYGTNVGAPQIRSNNLSSWKNRGINNYNHLLKNKIDNIKVTYDLLVDEYNTNNLLYNAEYNFEPIIGEVYHLYRKKGEENAFLSLIPPLSWNVPHIGSYKLNADNSWKKQ
ncbi:DUF2452 domain-containing protein [Cyclobacteriaceae bacterium]|nr:DUF2452 domain-containing protein [Cyclobacteriaceae bacterium]